MKSIRSLSASAVFLCACGGIANEPSIGGSGAADGGDATSKVRPPSGPLTEICDGDRGLTGQAMLDALERAPAATFRRYEDAPGLVAAGAPSPLTLRAHYDNGNVSCNPTHSETVGGRNPMVLPSAVELAVQLDFITADGVFNESIPLVLKGTTRDGAIVVEFEVTIPLSSIKGTFKTLAAKNGDTVRFFGAVAPERVSDGWGGVVHGNVVGNFDYK